MALTREGRALTAAHQAEQARIGARAAADALDAWSLLDLNDLDASMAVWLPVQAGLMRDRQAESARVADRYLTVFREVETGSPAGPVVRPTFNAPAAAVTARVAGPVAVKALIGNGVPADVAFDTGRRAVAGRVQKWALAGGRRTVRDSAVANRRATGYRRVSSSGAPCAFCAMLIARDITRGDFRSVGFSAHEHCRCVAEEIYEPHTPTDVEELWVQSYDEAAKATKAAGEAINSQNVLARMRRNRPSLFRDGVIVTS